MYPFERNSRTSKIAIAVATILGATCVQAAVAADGHTFDEQSNTHIWHQPDNEHGVFFPEKNQLQKGQNAKFNTTSSRWLLKDFKEGFAYSLGKVQFTNAPSDGTHKFFAVIDGSNEKDQSHPLDPNKTYLTINELRLGWNTSLQFSGDIKENTTNIKKLVVTTETADGHNVSEYNPLKNAVNIQTFDWNHKGTPAKSNSIQLNEVAVEDGASVTFSAKGYKTETAPFAKASSLTISKLTLGQKAQVLSGYAYGSSGTSGEAIGTTRLDNVVANGDSTITIDNGTLTLGSLDVAENKHLSTLLSKNREN